MDPRAYPHALLPLLQGRYRGAIEQLEELVNQDSGSWSAAGVNRVADLVSARLRSDGWTVERLPHRPGQGEPLLGDLVIGRRRGGLAPERGGRRLLLLAHMDTVFDDGEAAARPFRIADGRAHGPGVADDKGGLLAGIEAVEALCDDAGFDHFAEITLMCSPDEEIGSPFSKPLIRELAARHDVGVGLEAARTNGDLVSARKGMAVLEIDIAGRAVHAGVGPERGASAALEAAHKTVALHTLNRRWPGVTCNVGVLRSGTRPNVVAGRARLQVDLRSASTTAFEQAMAAAEAIAASSSVPSTTATMRVLHQHPPMERTPAVTNLVLEAQQVAHELGFAVGHTATGGAGDANTTSAAGLPTIDGLAPVGGDAHGPYEWLDLASVVPRTALLAGLLARLGSAAPPGRGT
ncbi:MAG TPA: M20 family metallopeptidase [Actinomycetes bacterium]|jgi:glutamate carboxypeptidase|nr:M20 family metallopeptidase [Actinomycetes bacterium]